MPEKRDVFHQDWFKINCHYIFRRTTVTKLQMLQNYFAKQLISVSQFQTVLRTLKLELSGVYRNKR